LNAPAALDVRYFFAGTAYLPPRDAAGERRGDARGAAGGFLSPFSSLPLSAPCSVHAPPLCSWAALRLLQPPTFRAGFVGVGRCASRAITSTGWRGRGWMLGWAHADCGRHAQHLFPYLEGWAARRAPAGRWWFSPATTAITRAAPLHQPSQAPTSTSNLSPYGTYSADLSVVYVAWGVCPLTSLPRPLRVTRVQHSPRHFLLTFPGRFYNAALLLLQPYM